MDKPIGLMVIDDIRDVVEGLTYGIPWKELGITVVASCLNGEEGLRLAEETEPDIIITDIRMPMMDGLSMTREILKRQPKCKIILITGYSDFDYAQQAVKLGAFDFVTKPFSLEEISDAVTRAKEALLADRELGRRMREMEQRVKESLPLLRQEFFNLLIRHQASERKVKERWEFLHIELDREHFIVMVLEVDQWADAGKQLPVGEIELLRFAMQNILEETIQAFARGIVFRESSERFVVIYNADPEHGPKLEPTLAELCCEHIARYTHHTVSVGVSLPVRHIADLPTAYRQAAAAISYHFYTGGNGVVYYSDIASVERRFPKYPGDRVQELSFMLQSGNKAKTLEALDEIYEELVSFQPRPEPRYLELLLQGIANMLLRTLIEKLPYEDVAPMEEWLREMQEAGGRNAHSIYELLRRLCTKGCELVEARSASHAHLVVEQAVAYIRHHLSDDLTVARCAAEVHLSGSYFANLFKKVTGTSFNQYVTGLRMDKAKEMLLQGMQIQEIASALGYEERRYFSDVFKKVTGMTPSEYRQSRQA